MIRKYLSDADRKFQSQQQKLGLASRTRKFYNAGDEYSIWDEKFLGVILFDGPSKITGENIVIIASFSSGNVKTGPMVQIWILRSDMSPVVAHSMGIDDAVCGDCTHRINNTCYVALFHGPRAVHATFQRGRYAHFDGNYDIFRGRKVRFGAYGDPALMDKGMVHNIAMHSAGWTGYTHQWNNPIGSPFKKYFQASCDTTAQKADAKDKGWGTFTVTPLGYDIKDLGKVTICPASISDDIQCIDCGKCDGANKFSRQIVIPAHGKRAKGVQWA